MTCENLYSVIEAIRFFRFEVATKLFSRPMEYSQNFWVSVGIPIRMRYFSLTFSNIMKIVSSGASSLRFSFALSVRTDSAKLLFDWGTGEFACHGREYASGYAFIISGSKVPAA